MSDGRLYFRQLLSGRDFATGDMLAHQMVNFCYLVGDRETGEAIAIDPAYGIDDLLAVLDADGMRLTGVLATHYHPDHVGGSMMSYAIEGVRDLLERGAKVKVHCQRDEAFGIHRVTDISTTDMVEHDDGDVLDVGAIPITLLHTPGHTPGSQCFLVDGRLVSGDTLFLDGCGRTDLPGGDAAQLYDSVHHRLAKLPDDTVLYPGHLYSADPSAPLGDVRARNYVFRFKTLPQWMQMFGDM
jgi:glyoxylase-like metal-dependent hydrolase (beta-lactamase superfamily II)